MVLIAAVLSMAACSSGNSTSPAGPATSTSNTSTTSTATPAGGSTDAGSGCDTVISAVKGAVTDSTVQSVDATGACTIVTLHTSLADTDLDKAVALCESAAKVAYTGSTSSVTVNGQSGKELAVGVSGNPCIGEP
jgi:hypothetical protein